MIQSAMKEMKHPHPQPPPPFAVGGAEPGSFGADCAISLIRKIEPAFEPKLAR